MKQQLATFLFLNFIVFAFLLPVKDASSIDFGSDIFSQKAAHENNIRDKLSKGIGSILKPNEYVLNVTITLEDEALAAQKRAKKKAEVERAENQVKNQLAKESQDNKQTPIVNAGDYNDGENALYIDKFDFSAPLGLDVNLQNNASNIGQLQIGSTPSIIDRIKDISVEILIDQNVSALRQSMVKELTQKINSPIAEILPNINFSTISLIPLEEINALKAKKAKEIAMDRAAEVKAKADEIKAKEVNNPFIKWLQDLKIPIAIILFGILMALVSLAAIGKLMKFGNKFLGTLDEVFSKSPSQQAAELPATGAGGEGFGAGSSVSMSGGSLSLDDDVPLVGFDRFMSLLKSSPNEALLLIRRWINQKPEGAIEGLTIIVKKSSTDDLMYMFDNLNVNERAKWKKLLMTDMDRNGLRLGDTFMEAQIMEDIILPPPTIDKEAKKILSKISPQECADIIKNDFEIGSILLNVLPTDFIADTYELLDSETALLLSDYGLNFTDGLLNEKKDDLNKILEKLNDQQNTQFAPFLDKIVEMIPFVGPEKEKTLFDSLFRNDQITILSDVSKEFFPTELIQRLPEDVIRKILMKYPRKQRVEFLLSISEADREFYLSVFGTESSKMRSFIEADISVVRENLTLMKSIKNFKDRIGRSFTHFFRTELKLDESVLSDIEKIIDEWIDHKSVHDEISTTDMYDFKEAA